MPFASIVFMQGDDANEPLDLLYSRESPDSIVYHGPTAESVAAAFAYLSQWDYGEPTEEAETPASGTSDDTWEQDGYRLSASLSYGYIGFERVTSRPVESYRCPCCGDDVSDTRPVCSDCSKAECEPSIDAAGELGYTNCQRPCAVCGDPQLADYYVCVVYERSDGETDHSDGYVCEDHLPDESDVAGTLISSSATVLEYEVREITR